MKLLHIDASILGDNSVSRKMSAAAVQRLSETNPGTEVTYRDLTLSPISHLTGRYLAGQSPEVQHDQALQEELALGGEVLEEFLGAETVVIGSPLYNFTVSSQLKAWIDRILVAGKTFRYGEQGAEGLVGGKRVVLCIARGGVYSAGSPHAGAEHAETYLRTVFGFIGVTHPDVLVAEGIALGSEQRAKALASGLQQAASLPAKH